MNLTYVNVVYRLCRMFQNCVDKIQCGVLHNKSSKKCVCNEVPGNASCVCGRLLVCNRPPARIHLAVRPQRSPTATTVLVKVTAVWGPLHVSLRTGSHLRHWATRTSSAVRHSAVAVKPQRICQEGYGQRQLHGSTGDCGGTAHCTLTRARPGRARNVPTPDMEGAVCDWGRSGRGGMWLRKIWKGGMWLRKNPPAVHVLPHVTSRFITELCGNTGTTILPLSSAENASNDCRRLSASLCLLSVVHEPNCVNPHFAAMCWLHSHKTEFLTAATSTPGKRKILMRRLSERINSPFLSMRVVPGCWTTSSSVHTFFPIFWRWKRTSISFKTLPQF
jgi:hypothetical protein